MRTRSFILAFIFLSLGVTSVHAQIRLDAGGNIAIGSSSTNSTQKLRVECTGATNCGSPGGTRIGVYGFADYGHSGYGLYGKAGGDSWASYGVYGEAHSFGYQNFGVYGKAGGGSHNWAGYFVGNVYATGTYQSSDEQLKTDVRSLRNTGMLALLMQLEPRRYRYKSAEEAVMQGLPDIGAQEGEHFGLLAGEVAAVFPELVIDVPHPVEERGESELRPEPITAKAINYIELIPVLIEAIREQQEEINRLKERL